MNLSFNCIFPYVFWKCLHRVLFHTVIWSLSKNSWWRAMLKLSKPWLFLRREKNLTCSVPYITLFNKTCLCLNLFVLTCVLKNFNLIQWEPMKTKMLYNISQILLSFHATNYFGYFLPLKFLLWVTMTMRIFYG